MKRILLVLLIIIAVFFLAFFLGPWASFDPLDRDTVSPISLEDAEMEVSKREALSEGLLEGNSAKLVWNDSTKQKTEYSIVYLHGFSASHEEGMPVHTEFAKRYGCNLFLSRMDGHGLVDTNAFKGIEPQTWVQSTEFAIEIGKAIGEKVIIMNCSTGATTGLYLAAGDPEIYAIFNYSPNIDLAGELDELLIGPWGKQIARLTFKGDYNQIKYSELQAKYWYKTYHIDGLIALKWLINQSMTRETFAMINQPVFMAYYYKNEKEQDPIVSVDRMLDFYNQISTPKENKRKVAFENGRHVMTSHIIPSPATEDLIQESYKFAEEVLNMIPI